MDSKLSFNIRKKIILVKAQNTPNRPTLNMLYNLRIPLGRLLHYDSSNHSIVLIFERIKLQRNMTRDYFEPLTET